MITVKGGGFSLLSDIFPIVYVGDVLCQGQQVVDSETITCVTPRFTTGGNRIVKVSQQVTEFSWLNVTGPNFNALATSIPTVTLLNSYSFSDPDLVTITATGTNLLLSGVSTSVKLVCSSGETLVGSITN